MNSTNLQDVEKICASMLAPLKKTYDLKHSIQSELSPQEIDEINILKASFLAI